MSTGNWPNFNGLIASQWPAGIDDLSRSFLPGGASNIVIGANPPWGLADFFTLYPKFGGPTAPLKGTLNGAILSGIDDTNGKLPGMPVAGPVPAPGQCPSIPGNTYILSIDSGTQITLNQSGLIPGAITLTVWDPKLYILPAAVLNAYIALASASLVQARWQSAWCLAMGWFVAHYVTLWLKSDGDACSDPGRAAASGLASGITVSKSVGPVSMSIQPLEALADWGAWSLTSYGQQLATMAKVIGMGPMLVW